MAPRKIPTLKIIEILRINKGLVSPAAKSLNITTEAIYKRARKEPEIKQAMDDCREAVIDLAENKLYDAVNNGKPWAICFLLKCLAKHRGYVERQEVSGPDGKDLMTKIEVRYVNAPKQDGEN